MKHLQRWVPDNCSSSLTDTCVFVEEWDDVVDPVARVHTFVSADRMCSRHTQMYNSDGSLAYSSNYEENRRKNLVWSMALIVKATLVLDQYKWSFNSSGLLVVNLGSALTTNQKNQLQSQCNLQFGPDKVQIQ